MKIQNFFVRVILPFSLSCLIVSCGRTRTSCTNQCSSNTKRCSSDHRAVESCQKIASTGCWDWTSRTCSAETRCSLTNGSADCEGNNTCLAPCTIGSKRCQGSSILSCQPSPNGQCSQWTTTSTCPTGQICDPSTKACKTGACAPVNLKAVQKCVGNTIYWFDDCGNQAQRVKQCNAGQTCERARCTAQTCTPKELQKQKKCVGNTIYWFDDCGNQAQRIEQCNTGQTCQNAQCMTPSGSCQGSHACGIGTTRCQGNATQKCEIQADHCRNWSSATPCSTGMKCSNGICIKDAPSGNGTVGSTCTNNNQCLSGGGCLKWPGGYCTVKCGQNNTCASGTTCVGLQSNQGTLNVCLKNCTSATQCRSGYACYKNRVCLYTGGATGGCRQNADCPSGQACNTSTGKCQQAGCTNNSQCTNGKVCQNGACITPPCTNNNQCTGGYVCKNGACVSPPCTKNSDCPSGQTCSGGICKGAGNPGTPGSSSTRSVTVNGTKRSYILYVGRGYTGTKAAPVLLAFHGSGDSASNYFQTSRWKPIADRYGIILAVMSKAGGSWDAVGAADSAYSDAVLQQVQNDHNADSKRLYAVGFSQGGYFVYRYGITRAATLAAFAVQSASNPGGRPVTPTRKIGVIFVIGTLDSAYSRAQQNAQSLKSAGHPVKLIAIPNAGHCCAAQHDKNTDVWQFFQQNPHP